MFQQLALVLKAYLSALTKTIRVPSAMMSTASLFPSLASALRAKRARNRTAKGVFPERFNRAAESDDSDDGSSMVMLMGVIRKNSENF